MRPTPSSNDANRGALGAFLAYFLWGIFPLFWKQLRAIDAVELIAHRMVWSFLLLLVILAIRHRGTTWWQRWSQPRTLAWSLLSGSLLTANWLIFVWAVNHGFVIECSLGYFLVPLINALLGRLVFQEILRPGQGVALALAAFGVGILVWQVGHVPWIGLGIALTFSLYGLLRKQSELGPLTGLATETLLMAPFAVAWLAWRGLRGAPVFHHGDTSVILWLLSTSVVTATPLLLFAYGARRLRMTTLGLLQYVAPTGQFLLGWLLYDEAFTMPQATAFGFIWAGLACYSVDAWRAGHRARRAPQPPTV